MSSNGIHGVTEGKEDLSMISHQFPLNTSHMKSQPSYYATMITKPGEGTPRLPYFPSRKALRGGSVAEKLGERTPKLHCQGAQSGFAVSCMCDPGKMP